MSKLTYYVQRFPNQSDHDFVTAAVGAGVSSLKIEGQLSEIEYAYLLNPALFLAYRNIAELEGDDDGGFKQDYKFGEGDPKVAAAAHVALVNQTMGTRASYAYICSPYNEVGMDSKAAREWYNAFECERQRLYGPYAGAGARPKEYTRVVRHALIFCVGVKANLHDKIGELLPAIQMAYDLGNVIDTHAYNSPRLDDAGPFGNDVSEGLLPHRLIYDALKARGLACPRFFFGEGGHDTIASSGKYYDGFRVVPLSNAQVVEDWQKWEDMFIKWVQVLFVKVPSGPAHPADKLLIGVATFIFSDAQAIQPDYNTKWGRSPTKQDPDGDPGVAYRWLDVIRKNHGDPVPATGSAGTTPAPTPDPTPGPTGVQKVKVVSFCNQRSAANINSTLLGRIEAGAYQVVQYPPTNGYVQAIGQDYWLLAANLKIV